MTKMSRFLKVVLSQKSHLALETKVLREMQAKNVCVVTYISVYNLLENLHRNKAFVKPKI